MNFWKFSQISLPAGSITSATMGWPLPTSGIETAPSRKAITGHGAASEYERLLPRSASAASRGAKM
eukprot:7124476-Lingulodinium_polyedra.AAC.1